MTVGQLQRLSLAALCSLYGEAYRANSWACACVDSSGALITSLPALHFAVINGDTEPIRYSDQQAAAGLHRYTPQGPSQHVHQHHKLLASTMTQDFEQRLAALFDDQNNIPLDLKGADKRYATQHMLSATCPVWCTSQIGIHSMHGIALSCQLGASGPRYLLRIVKPFSGACILRSCRIQDRSPPLRHCTS